MSQEQDNKASENATHLEEAKDLKTSIIAVLLMSLIVVPTGWFFGNYIAHQTLANNTPLKVTANDSLEKKPEQNQSSDDEHKLPPDMTRSVVKLAPVITNLCGENGKIGLGDYWVRAEISLVLKPGAHITEVIKEKISNDFLSYFRSLTMLQINGSSALMNIKEDLLSRANLIADNKIDEILTPVLVVE